MASEIPVPANTVYPCSVIILLIVRINSQAFGTVIIIMKPKVINRLLRVHSMKSLLFAISILFVPVFAFAASLEGTWAIRVSPIEKEQFPWWQQIKYPMKLAISKVGSGFEIQFTDQFGDTCTGAALSANMGKEIVFEYCGGLGTKSDLAWGPIHHAKVVNGLLQGVVTTNQHVFNWVGERDR